MTQPRIEIKPNNQYPLWIRYLLSAQKKKYGAEFIPTKLWGQSPWLCFALMVFFLLLERKSSPLSPVLRSLVMVRTAQLNWCTFCVDLTGSFLAKRSGSMDKVMAVENWSSSNLFEPSEKAALRYAECMSDSRLKVTDDVYASLKEHFSSFQIIELTGLIAFQNLSAKFNAALDVPPQGFCKLQK